MRQGFRVIDSDTHVNPSLDVLLRHADAELRARLGELEPYRRTVKVVRGRGDADDVDTSSIPGHQAGAPAARGGREAGAGAGAGGRPRVPVRAARRWSRASPSRRVSPRITPPAACATWTPRAATSTSSSRARAYGAPALAPHLTKGLYRAYHRYMAEYCSADSRRLKCMVLATATDPAWSARVIAEHAREDWVAAVWPLLPEGVPVDDPDLEPIRAAAAEADLPIMFHAFTIETPYFPGYRDIWDNPAMGRCAGQTWGGQRFLSFMPWAACSTAIPICAWARSRAATAGCPTGSRA